MTDKAEQGPERIETSLAQQLEAALAENARLAEAINGLYSAKGSLDLAFDHLMKAIQPGYPYV